MKMVKSLLLVSAAGLVAVSGAQAADLPVKAKPVEYVKVCSLYGAGFYYIPGTDICFKVGGYVRFQTYLGGGNAPGQGPFVGAAQVQQSRQFNAANDLVSRTRSVATFDSRQQTAYGTLRTYLLLGYTHENGTNGAAGVGNAASLYATRGFIQIAGFTFGKATSFYDFYQSAAVGYLVTPSSDTGDGGVNVAAYTAQFGNGVSATISAEDPRNLSVSNTSIPGAFVVGANPAVNNGNTRVPDIVGAARIDQAWGSAQIMAAYHNVTGAYYGATATGAINNGGPNEKAGFAIGGGLRLNAPVFGPGDYFQAQASYTEGAGKYLVNTPPLAGSPARFDGNSLGVGWWSDGVYNGLTAATGSDIQLTTAWGFNASYEHFWTPALRTSVYGGIVEFTHNAAATTAICANAGAAGALTLTTATNCNPDFKFVHVGTRSQWNVTKDFYVGVDVMYQRLESAFANGTATFTAAAGLPKPTGVYRIQDQDTAIVSWRVHRDIVP